MDREKLKNLLEAKPLKVTEGTTFATQRLIKRVNEQQELIDYLAQCLSTQAASIIQLREHLNAQKGAIEVIADAGGFEQEDRSMIEMPKNQLVGLDGQKLS